MGSDPIKIQIVRSCLEAASREFRSAKPKRLFDFNDSDFHFEVEFDGAFINDIPGDRLKIYLELHLIPKMKANPDKKFYVSNNGIQMINNDSDWPTGN